MDIKFKKDKYWDIDFKDGDFEMTQGLDTALFLSVLGERRNNDLPNPILRRGHFTNQFSDVEGYEVGSLLWFYSQLPKTESNRSLIESDLTQSLQWMIDDGILNNLSVSVAIIKDGYNVTINTSTEFQNNYYDLFIKTWQ